MANIKNIMDSRRVRELVAMKAFDIIKMNLGDGTTFETHDFFIAKCFIMRVRVHVGFLQQAFCIPRIQSGDFNYGQCQSLAIYFS